MIRNIYLRVAFDGTDFHGWQHQPGQRTVQQVCEDVLQRVVRHPIDLFGCGRTDAGVHAAAHVSNFLTDSTLAARKIGHAVRARLPADMELTAIREVDVSFHARRSAVSKLYRYRIHHHRSKPIDRGTQRYTYHCWRPLDLDRMRAASRHYVGGIDFTSMTPTHTVRETMVRRVFRCDIDRHLDEVRIDVLGEGFLYRQVRNMVGTLIEIGRGYWEPDYLQKILAKRDRTAAGPTAPAEGLSLQWVRYPPDVLRPATDEASIQLDELID